MRGVGLGVVAQIALVVAMLALGRPVLVPVALAFYFAFVLTPPSDALERRGLPRALSVASVVGVLLAALVVLGVVLVAQIAELARQMQTYSLQISQKLASVRADGLGVFNDLSKALSDLSAKLDPAQVTPDKVTAVRVVTDGLSAFRQVEDVLGPIVAPVALVVIVLVMTVFALAHREDLRERLLQLVGPNNLTLATRTMAEAVNRVSHLLVTQVYINTGFGAVISLGLYSMGIPYAVLWGALAGLLRFVPMLGALIAPIFPTLIAFAIFPGWLKAALTLGLFLAIDAVLGNVIEPMVLGKRTGVSALSLLISALFWTWLWGPLGLVLATPLTICAAVLGRHVPELSFLAIALGDEVGLSAGTNFYQRTLAKATRDAHRLAKQHARESSLPDTFDEVVVPALGLMAADLNLQAIDQSAANRVVQDMSEVIDRLQASEAVDIKKPRAGKPIVGVSAESSADALLLRMVRITLERRASAMVEVGQPADRSKALAAVLQHQPELVCIAALPPSGTVNARFLCRRLRAEAADVFIVVLLPGSADTGSREADARLREAGANAIAYDVRQAAKLLEDNAREP